MMSFDYCFSTNYVASMINKAFFETFMGTSLSSIGLEANRQQDRVVWWEKKSLQSVVDEFLSQVFGPS